MLNWRDPRNPKAGGAERVTQAYLRGLLERGHEAFWFANEFPGCVEQESVDGIQIVRGGGSGSSVLRARRWYGEQKAFDLVIDQHHGIPWFAPWWCRTNCIAYIHEVLGPIWRAFYPWPISWFGMWQERLTHRLYGNVTFWTPSNSTCTALKENGVRQVKVLPNGIDTVPLKTLEHKVLERPIRLITVSRLAPNKRVSHAIQAVKILDAKGIEAHLTILGTGDEEPRLRAEARMAGLEQKVVFGGGVSESEKNRQLAEAHLLLHASIREGWGLNVIEANAMGTPAIVYPVGGLVDSTVHEETGIVVAEETPAALASGIERLVQAPEKYESLRVRAWERARTFQWENVLPVACDWLEQQARGARK